MVQTTFPELKISAEVLGSFILKTNPGNCSGLYSVIGRVAASFSNGTSCPKSVDTTIFTTSILVLVKILFCLQEKTETNKVPIKKNRNRKNNN